MPSSGVAYDVGSWRLGDDGCIHRRGRMRFSNGDVYEGEWVDGKRHGKGTFRFTNGSSYIGDFDENFFHGFGLLTIARTQHPLTKKWLPGEKYDGEFRKGKKHGRGMAKTAAGDTFDGEFQCDYYHGRGVCAYANGEIYDGQWVRGKWHGQGELRRKDGSIYVGGLVNGLCHGYGKHTYGAGGRHGLYSGDYRFGQRHGKGIRVFGDGKRYEGDWRDDVMHGVGMMECDDFKYVGEFSHGTFHGHGVLSLENGDAFEGSFVQGAFEGHGRYDYADGGRYDGAFVSAKRHGRGRRVFSTGDVYDGEWQHDRMHGRGLLERNVVGVKGGTATYRYDGDFLDGQQTGNANVTFTFTPTNVDDLFEWTTEYEFPVGSGFWHCGRGASTYIGTVHRGAFHGDGTLASPDGRRWRGQWVHGQLHGEAQCIYLPLVHEHILDNEKLPMEVKKERARQARGLYRIVRYDGAFAHNVRHGRGRVLFENGDSLCGQFVDGFAHGVVTYQFATDKKRRAEFKRGHRVRWFDDDEAQATHALEVAEHATQTQENGRRDAALRALMA